MDGSTGIEGGGDEGLPLLCSALYSHLRDWPTHLLQGCVPEQRTFLLETLLAFGNIMLAEWCLGVGIERPTSYICRTLCSLLSFHSSSLFLEMANAFSLIPPVVSYEVVMSAHQEMVVSGHPAWTTHYLDEDRLRFQLRGSLGIAGAIDARQ